jgi:hypothetical protein
LLGRVAFHCEWLIKKYTPTATSVRHSVILRTKLPNVRNEIGMTDTERLHDIERRLQFRIRAA